jgi:hypothetical protein
MVTEVTTAEAEDAREEPACALTTEANACPFWSSEIFFAALVLPLKNASKFDLIAACAAAPVDAPEAAAEAADVVLADEGADVADAWGVELALGALDPLLPQAATAPTSSTASNAPRAGGRKTRR